MARSKRTTSKRARSEEAPNPVEEELELLDELDELEDDSDFEADSDSTEEEEIDEIDELEPWDEDDGDVQITHQLDGVEGCDVQLTLSIGDMEKAAVTDAITAPLQTAVAGLANELRWRRVRVMFFGDTLIPSAAKQRVAEILAEVKPLEVTVQRGFGDEHVLQNELPVLQWASESDASYALRVRVVVSTGELDSADLPTALRAHVEKAAADAAGKSFDIAFEGRATPDAATRDFISETLSAAGASRVAITGNNGAVDVLFDRVLEDRVVVQAADDGACDTIVDLTLTDDEGSTAEALALTLSRARPQLQGKRVRVRPIGRALQAGEVAALLCHAAGLQPVSLELDQAGEVDLLWPMLLSLSQGETASTLTVDPAGRTDQAIAAAMRREAAGLAPAAGRPLTIDWPAGFPLDSTIEQSMAEALAKHAPSSLAYTFGGTDREPVQPPGVAVVTGGGGAVICELDTDAGKPADLARAIRRRLPQAAADLAGQRVEVRVEGSGALSRTLRRALREELDSAGVAGARLVDHGAEDVLLPRLLRFENASEGVVRVTMTPAGRTDAQLESAVARELETADLPPDATVHLLGGDHAAVIAGLVAGGAARVCLDGAPERQVHPSLFAAPSRDADMLTLVVANGPAAAADPRSQLERELPPLVESGVAGISVTLVWPGRAAADALVARALEMILAHEPAMVFFDDGDGLPLQVHPDLPEPEPEPEPQLESASQPEPELQPESAPHPQDPPTPSDAPQVTVLGRLDDAAPPMLLLGIDWTQSDAGRAAVEAALTTMISDLSGRRILIVFRAGGRDRAAPDHRPLVQIVQRIVAPAAAALLFYRTPAAPAAPHFEVVHSTLEQLPLGSVVGDPRRRP